IFGGAGLLCSLSFIFDWSLARRGDFIIAPATLGLIVGLFLIPVPHYHYYVLFLPLVALFGATFVIESVTKLADLRDRLTVGQWTSVAALISIAILTVLIFIAQGAESHWPLFLIIGYWFVVLFGCMALIFRRAPAVALVFFFVAMILGPLKRLQST